MSRKGYAMKVIRIRIGVLVASCGLLAGALGLTVIAGSSASHVTFSVASVASSTACATVIEAGRCAG